MIMVQIYSPQNLLSGTISFSQSQEHWCLSSGWTRNTIQTWILHFILLFGSGSSLQSWQFCKYWCFCIQILIFTIDATLCYIQLFILNFSNSQVYQVSLHFLFLYYYSDKRKRWVSSFVTAAHRIENLKYVFLFNIGAPSNVDFMNCLFSFHCFRSRNIVAVEK